MPRKNAPKVAYAVFVGRIPGVYSTWYDSLALFHWSGILTLDQV